MKILISTSKPYQSLTDSEKEAFHRWFGKSVVTKNGEPLRVYHGSPNDIKFFDSKFTGTGNDEAGIGFYFTSDPDDANRYTNKSGDRSKAGHGGNILPVYLKITRPIYFDKQPNLTQAQARNLCAPIGGRKRWHQFLRDTYDVDFMGIEAAKREYYDSIVGTSLIEASFSIYNDIYVGSGREHLFPQIFKEATRYDGIVRKIGGVTHYIVFSAAQIKSAIGNKGTFKRNDKMTE